MKIDKERDRTKTIPLCHLYAKAKDYCYHFADPTYAKQVTRL